MPFPVLVLLLVFLLIPLRKIRPLDLHIWQIMTGGAALLLLAGQITPPRAFQAVNWDVMLFLFGMFVVGEALEESGYLSCLAYRLFSKAHTPHRMTLFVLFGMGTASAFLMNDTLAIIGTPVVLFLAEKYRLPRSLMLLCLAFSITIGSVASPIGNPQNLLVALGARLPNPFFVFFKYLFLPTVVNLLIADLVLNFFTGAT